MKSIAFFNNKGGVSKTTTVFHLGWKLASKGKRVLLVDADPQCNLTGMILGYRGPSELESLYKKQPDNNVKAGLAPAYESRPNPIQPLKCIDVLGRDGLFLMPGHIGLSEYEVSLGMAQELSSAIPTLMNLPGAFSFLISRSAAKLDIDYVLIDLSPSLGAINQNLLMTSNYFIVPTNPDFFSVMSIDSMSTVLTRWAEWSKKAQAARKWTNASYPYPDGMPIFLGTIIQRFRLRLNAPATKFQTWIDEINSSVVAKLLPVLQTGNMLLPNDRYKSAGISDTYCLAEISDFNSLIALSQEKSTPVFALSQEQMNYSGVIKENMVEKRDQFDALFDHLAQEILQLT
jgi:cellulose biosynthesis protein BcsQ